MKLRVRGFDRSRGGGTWPRSLDALAGFARRRFAKLTGGLRHVAEDVIRRPDLHKGTAEFISSFAPERSLLHNDE